MNPFVLRKNKSSFYFVSLIHSITMGKVLGVIFMNKKKEKTQEKKLEGVIVKPEESRDLIKKNLMEMFKKQGIKVKKG